MIIATYSPIGVITTEITVERNDKKLVITADGVMTASIPSLHIITKEVALRGPSSNGSEISLDPANRLTLGTDDKLYVADNFTPDPLNYYLLERGNI